MQRQKIENAAINNRELNAAIKNWKCAQQEIINKNAAINI